MERPTGRSLIVICLRMPLSSIMKRPLRRKDQTWTLGDAYKSRSILSALRKYFSNLNIPVSNAFVLLQYTIILRDGSFGVSHQRDLHVSQATLLPGGVYPDAQKERKVAIIDKTAVKLLMLCIQFWLFRRRSPGQVAKVRVHGCTDHLTVDLFEFICCVTEGDDLSGTHEGEVQRVEEENYVLPCRKKKSLLILVVVRFPVFDRAWK